MEKEEFVEIRKRLGKTQKQIALLLGTSLRAVKSFEQGWRKVPVYAERQLILLLSLMKAHKKKNKPCWEFQKCPLETRQKCPAWEFHAGHICWFINGTICQGEEQKDWNEKMKICRQCEVFRNIIS